jgi:hypothetical protein
MPTTPSGSDGPHPNTPSTPNTSKFSLCWQAEMRSRRDGENCVCAPRPAPVCHGDLMQWRTKPAAQAQPRLAVAVSAHVVKNTDWVLLLRCICSIFSHHNDALVLLTDNDSPTSLQTNFVASLAGEYNAGGRIISCRNQPSGWSLGALGWAAERALDLGATHFAYLQHTMRLRKPLPLHDLARRNCSLMSFQHFAGTNFDTQERLPKWILRSWVVKTAKRLNLSAERSFSGMYSRERMYVAYPWRGDLGDYLEIRPNRSTN